MRLIDADALINRIVFHTDWSADEKEAFEDEINVEPTIELKQKLIPVSERLPEEDGEYLVLYYIRSQYKTYMYDIRSFANDLYKIDEYDFHDKKRQKGWFYYDREYGFCEDNNVYAWMPLPEPYREEGEK